MNPRTAASTATEDAAPLFVVGCPRSGTTWVQLLLASHPRVATANETHLFSGFVGPCLERWRDLRDDPRSIGLEGLIEREEFEAWLRDLARKVIRRIGDGERLAVEKTPDHALHGDALLSVFPRCRILHVVRDPRDVCASLLAAGSDWAGHWAPDSAYDAAWFWRDRVEAARRLAERTDRYRELTYESLDADPAARLQELFAWLGLDAPSELVRNAVAENRISRLREGEGGLPWEEDPPDAFFRRGGSGNWRDDLRAGEVAVVEHVCRRLMSEYGYEGSSRLVGLGVPPPRLAVHWLRDRIRRRIG